MSASVDLVTFRDTLDYLADYQSANPDARTRRFARHATFAALRELANAHRWAYYYQLGRLNLVAPFTEGTITYDHTGAAAAERLVTLTSAEAWPSWATFGVLYINDVSYDVAERLSATEIQLSVHSNPGADIATATSFTLYRDCYVLPVDFISADEVSLEDQCYTITYVHPREWLWRRRCYNLSSGTPRFYCVPDDHEILTARGWKYCDQVTVGEPVMTYDHRTGELAWKPLCGVHVFDYDGELLSFSNPRGGMRFEFTPDHRWPTISSWGTRRMLPARDLNTATSIPRCGNFSGTESILSPQDAAALGWAVTDGTALFAKDHWNTRVYQSPKKHLAEVCAVLEADPRKPHPDTGVCAVPMPRAMRARIRSVIRTLADLPQVVCQLSRGAAEAMLDAMVKADGHERPGQTQFAQYTDANYPVVEAFQILCLLTGKHANICKAKWLDRHRWGCNINRRKTLKPCRNWGKPLHYRGKIWCPETEWGTWVMRHDGHTIITGNTVKGSTDYQGCLDMCFYPYNDSAETADFIYHRRPRKISIEAFSTGLVSANILDDQVTGGAGNFTTDMIGALIRLSDDGQTIPTGKDGANPYATERMIMDVADDGASLTVDQNFTDTFTNVKYMISDPIDIEVGAMLTAFHRCAEYQMGRALRTTDVEKLRAAWMEALIQAREADVRTFTQRAVGDDVFYQRLADMPAGADIE